MANWLADAVQLLFGPRPNRVTANDEGVEVRGKSENGRMAWSDITEVWGGRSFGHDLFLIYAGDRKVSFGWPDKGVAETMRVVETKLPGFPGAWYDMIAHDAPFELILWSKSNQPSSNGMKVE